MSIQSGLLALHQVSPLPSLFHPRSTLIFSTACFAAWAPNLFSYYVDHLRPLYAKYPQLKRNFLNSVFACATFNFGPTVCTFDHTDPGNLPFGWCAITALGKFDPTLFNGSIKGIRPPIPTKRNSARCRSQGRRQGMSSVG